MCKEINIVKCCKCFDEIVGSSDLDLFRESSLEKRFWGLGMGEIESIR